MRATYSALAAAALLLAGCKGDTGLTGPQGPAATLTEVDLTGSWSGAQLDVDASGAFVTIGTRSITFDGHGTYTSDIFSAGTGPQTGSYRIIGSSVAVTVPNPGFTPFVTTMDGVEATHDSLKFSLPLKPIASATSVDFALGVETVYLLARN